jgi:hypothetical protein
MGSTAGILIWFDWHKGFGAFQPRCTKALKETGPLCPCHPSWEQSHLAKAPHGPQVLACNVLWLQERGAQVCMPNRSQGLISTEDVGRGLLLRSTPPAQWTICQPHQMEVPT